MSKNLLYESLLLILCILGNKIKGANVVDTNATELSFIHRIFARVLVKDFRYNLKQEFDDRAALLWRHNIEFTLS